MIEFTCYGNRKIKATHQNTLELTKGSSLTDKGDCIIGIRADFNLNELIDFVNEYRKFRIVLKCGNKRKEIIAESNQYFCDEHEIVIRKSDFLSERTLGINADKAASDLNRDFVKAIQKDTKIEVFIEPE